ncbi:MAG: histidine phosphatase family protein [Bacteroidales bacterium]|nr:histidine phosphatase family protein [Bacteroidales bacterium]
MIQFQNISNIGSNTSFVLRHSSRNHIPDGVDHRTVGLNEEGMRLSEEFGHSLRGKTTRLKFLSSPIMRCIQTCEHIVKGFGKACDIRESNVLGEPGPFVVNREVGGILFGICGTHKATELIQKGIRIDGIRTGEAGAQMLFDLAVNEMEDDCTTILVSHDAIVAPFVNHYTGEYFCKEHWLDFVDGAVVRKESEGKYHIYRDNKLWDI